MVRAVFVVSQDTVNVVIVFVAIVIIATLRRSRQHTGASLGAGVADVSWFAMVWAVFVVSQGTVNVVIVIVTILSIATCSNPTHPRLDHCWRCPPSHYSP
jgi:hypothetical protein